MSCVGWRYVTSLKTQVFEADWQAEVEASNLLASKLLAHIGKAAVAIGRPHLADCFALYLQVLARLPWPARTWPARGP